ncbi:conserved hypothetical protein [Pediculus humanus corporis]|uniref:Uncharacterized protein n=1 Tax=Pediculus humanus subsp. corporis TaxID=121224 RepID=E0VA97_PEDHC|nr:uncharacterized protein Phum_PHUM032470 [Pediculus humanus corporis]EEB10303.1 conserved hypothetical protein [Pediculus humanus corporis]
MERDKPCVMTRPPLVDNLNPNHFPGVSQLTLTAPPTDEFGNPRMISGGSVNPNSDDPNRNNPLDSNDLKNQMTLKNVNNNNNNINSNNSNASSNNTNNNSNNSNSSCSNNNSNNCSNNSSGNNGNSNNSPMNRLMGRNMNGQSNRNVPMDNPMGHNVVNPPNNVLDASENMDSLQDQNSHMMQQFQEEQKKKKGSRTDSPVSRGCNKMQGPPPPYHQTARSASVPIAVPNSNPGSPSNTTSNLSLPSPRTSSDLNSPSDVNKHVPTSGNSSKLGTCSPPNNQGSPSCSKLMPNNPDTPVSASQSPTSNSRKDSSQSGLDFPSKVSSLTQQKHQKQQNASANKEPNLMPVPSPQQIHYLNTFEGQELTIQKQPNTSLKETNINSPLNHTPLSDTPKCKTPNGAANSPLPQVPETSPRFPSIATSTSTTCTTPVSTQSQSSVVTSKDAAGPSPCRPENLPLNPNGLNCPPNNKSMHFDPITSLAQMSQQLTNQTTPPCPGPGPMMSYNSSSMHMVGNLNHMEQHVGPVGAGGPMGPMGHDNPPMENMQFPPNNPIISCAGPMIDMPPGFLNTSSPKQNMNNPPPRCVAPFFGGPGFQKMMGPNNYNGMNVQVKASTPNTIQYLPARPNTNNSKVSFIPNCHSNSMDGVNTGGNPGMNCGGPIGNSSGNLMSNSVSNMLLGGNMVLNPGPVGPLRGQLRAGPGGMMKVPQMGGGNGGGGGGGPVFPPGPGGCDPMVLGSTGGNPNMFIQGSKSSPLGMPPEASQPLPPSMSQGTNFKNSPFVGPTVADPNYAQQFHNFQQQLYATNTRSHQMNSHMNQSYFLPK